MNFDQYYIVILVHTFVNLYNGCYNKKHYFHRRVFFTIYMNACQEEINWTITFCHESVPRQQIEYNTCFETMAK